MYLLRLGLASYRFLFFRVISACTYRNCFEDYSGPDFSFESIDGACKVMHGALLRKPNIAPRRLFCYSDRVFPQYILQRLSHPPRPDARPRPPQRVFGLARPRPGGGPRLMQLYAGASFPCSRAGSFESQVGLWLARSIDPTRRNLGRPVTLRSPLFTFNPRKK
ncbi:hypothetical protein DFH07DRAFT_346881 [Mycena maculata]|uniref:Secreted protein n=1 Tax=Mycena maculata TaxID=230809 RepID=A0AAD7HCF7_9AGAR|nr:hypothetical protein DFH07DRAFT_346881 [Mycena maculata]